MSIAPMSASDANLRRYVGFELALSERHLIRDGRRIPLEPRAFDTLAYLAERGGRLVRKRELIAALWPGMAVTDNALTRCISEARKALGDNARSPRYIQTIPRLGYRFVGESIPEATAGPDVGAAAASPTARRRSLPAAWWYGGSVLLLVVIAAALSFRTSTEPPGDVVDVAAAPPRSIAVLPFLNLSDDARNSYLSDALAENLLDLLAAIPDVKVVARTSSFAFRERPVDAREVGRALGVAWLLEGSVQGDGDRLRVTVQLIDASTGYHTWSRRYDRQRTDIFALQDEIAAATASMIGSEIGATVRATEAPTEDLEAYRQYLIGREHVRGRGPRWRDHAGEAFAGAIKRDASFAAAHAGLASVLAIKAFFTGEGKGEQLAHAKGAAERALELDPELAIGHAAMGLVLDLEDAPAAEIERHYRTALERDPLLIEAHNWLAAFLFEEGRVREAQRQRDVALTLDPLNPVLLENRSANAELGGQYDLARDAATRLLALPHRPHIAWHRLGEVEAAFGNLIAALQAHRNAVLELEPPYRTYESGRVAMILGRLGLFDDAQSWLQRLDQEDPRLSEYHFNVRARQGDLERTSAILRMPDPSPHAYAPFVQKRIEASAMREIWLGDFAAAIRILTPLRDKPAFLFLNSPDQLPGPTEGAQLLALGYQRTGRASDAGELLETVLESLERHEQTHGGIAPGLAYEKAACLALLGRESLAAEALASAVESGWNDWHRARHDVRWEAFRERQWFKTSLARALDDLERQRRELQSLEAAGDVLAALP